MSWLAEGRKLSGFVLQGEVKDNHTRPIPRYEDAVYGQSTTNYLKADASTGKHYVDLSDAMENYRGAWLYGNEHVVTNVGRLRAEWEQFCPVPADIRDGVLIRGNVLYRHTDGSWAKSNDQFEGVLRTVHGPHGGRFFVGRTQHTFYGRQFPGGALKVIAQLNLKLSQRSSANPLFPMPARNNNNGNDGGAETLARYQRSNSSYSQPSISSPASEPGYESDDTGDCAP